MQKRRLFLFNTVAHVPLCLRTLWFSRKELAHRRVQYTMAPNPLIKCDLLFSFTFLFSRLFLHFLLILRKYIKGGMNVPSNWIINVENFSFLSLIAEYNVLAQQVVPSAGRVHKVSEGIFQKGILSFNLINYLFFRVHRL